VDELNKEILIVWWTYH